MQTRSARQKFASNTENTRKTKCSGNTKRKPQSKELQTLGYPCHYPSRGIFAAKQHRTIRRGERGLVTTLPRGTGWARPILASRFREGIPTTGLRSYRGGSIGKRRGSTGSCIARGNSGQGRGGLLGAWARAGHGARGPPIRGSQVGQGRAGRGLWPGEGVRIKVKG